jgi:uncharacterized membrane protein YfcA
MLAPATALRFDPNQHGGTVSSPPKKCRALITDPLFYLIAIVAVILLGLSKGGFFGLGVMALPLMSLEVPPLQAAAIILPTVIAQDVLTVWTYRHTWSAWNLKIMIPSMAAGIMLGTLFAASLTAAHIRLAIGLIAGLFVLRHWLDKLTYVGTFSMLFAASNLIKIPAYGALGQLTFDNLAIGALLLPLAVAANYAGIWLVQKTPTELFFRIAYVLMFLISIELIRSGLVEMLRA